MTEQPAQFPYDTRLDIQYRPLEVIDVPALVKTVTHPGDN